LSKQEAELERVYTVPLSRAWITARHKRTKRAVNILREFAERHMKSSEIKIDTELNEQIWRRGITSPPRRITVKMSKDEDGLVTISLPKAAKITPMEPTKVSETEGKISVEEVKEAPQTEPVQPSGSKSGSEKASEKPSQKKKASTPRKKPKSEDSNSD